MATGLTAKQQIFADEYLKDFNGTKAAIRAGYSIKTAEVQASKLLSKGKVKEYVDAKRAKISEKAIGIAELNAEWVLRMLKTNADLAQAAEDYGPSNKAIELIGKHLTMFTETLNLKGGLTSTHISLTAQEARELNKALEDKI